MEVLFWQAFIAISIIVVFLFAKPLKKFLSNEEQSKPVDKVVKHINPISLGAIGSSGWIIWTLIFLRGPLLIFQLGLIGFVFVGCLVIYLIFGNKDSEIKRKDYRLNELSKEFEFLKNSKSISWISTPEQHREILINALKNSKKRLVILSGWVTDYSMDHNFRNLLLNAIKRGVRVYIGYGYREKYEKKLKRREQNEAEKHLQNLREWCAENNPDGSINVCYIPNHKKLLIVDSLYLVVGSFNWLSNSGKGINAEESVGIKDKEEIDKKADEIIPLIENCPSDKRTLLKMFVPFLKN